MVDFDQVRSQLINIGSWPSLFGRPEKRELANILHPGEQLMEVVTGWYDGGTAILVATDQRLLLVDKKIMYLNVEDLRYDMIAEVMYQASLIDTSVTITCAMKTLTFKSWTSGKLRKLTAYIQERILEFRHYNETLMHAAENAVSHTALEGGQRARLSEENSQKGVSWADYERWVEGRKPPKISIRRPYGASPFRRRKIGGFMLQQANR